jgi:hypothetical protein
VGGGDADEPAGAEGDEGHWTAGMVVPMGDGILQSIADLMSGKR